jgi:hypothetical protein
MVLGSGIPDPRSGIRDPEKTYSGSRILDPGSRGQKAPNPGSRIRISNVASNHVTQSCQIPFLLTELPLMEEL